MSLVRLACSPYYVYRHLNQMKAPDKASSQVGVSGMPLHASRYPLQVFAAKWQGWDGEVPRVFN